MTGRHVASTTSAGSVAEVLYRAERVGGGSLYLKVVLVKEGDEWKALSFQSSETPLKSNF